MTAALSVGTEVTWALVRLLTGTTDASSRAMAVAVPLELVVTLVDRPVAAWVVLEVAGAASVHRVSRPCPHPRLGLLRVSMSHGHPRTTCRVQGALVVQRRAVMG